MKETKTLRVASIDVFRALTMLLMIWVNDFWTLINIPKWLEHAKASEDYLGFSDLIFPWFLFIVGMSIPFAIENRLKKGDTYLKILWHILVRSVALLVMGVFLVNTESYHAEATGMAKPWFNIIMISAIFLVWNVYPKAIGKRKYMFAGFQVAGVLILAYLAYIYRGTTYTDPQAIVPFQKRWWGILGLIGWTYVVAAPLYLFFRKVKYSMWFFWLAFIALNIIGNSGISYNIFPGQQGRWIVGDGAFHAFAFGGIVTSGMVKRFQGNSRPTKFYLVLLWLALATAFAGFFTRNYFPISKIGATPPWVFFSLLTAFLLFIVLHWLVDVKGKRKWFNSIKIAGTATLTCYLVPYYYYSFMTLLHLKLPETLRTSWVGLVKSMIYAFIVVGITWGLGKLRIKLKI